MLAKSCVLLVFIVFSTYFDDHGGRRGDTAQALARWRHPVASSVALDVLHQAMHIVLDRCIAVAIEMVSNSPAFLSRRFRVGPQP
jgi:hypothetical protein